MVEEYRPVHMKGITPFLEELNNLSKEQWEPVWETFSKELSDDVTNLNDYNFFVIIKRQKKDICTF